MNNDLRKKITNLIAIAVKLQVNVLPVMIKMLNPVKTRMNTGNVPTDAVKLRKPAIAGRRKQRYEQSHSSHVLKNSKSGSDKQGCWITYTKCKGD